MKVHPFPIRTHRIGEASKRPDESQVVVLLDAPCRNRTCNLMIKSQLQPVRSGFVGGVNSLLSESVRHWNARGDTELTLTPTQRLFMGSSL